jgi:hypothetical protein
VINSYKELERGYMFEPNSGLADQHRKIVEEFDEVSDEVLIIPEKNCLFFKSTLKNYIHEMQDLMLACNNQILRMEKEYGKQFIRDAMKDWDDKMEYYKTVKYLNK